MAEVYVNGIEDKLKLLRDVVKETTGHHLSAKKLRLIRRNGGFVFSGLETEEAVKMAKEIAKNFTVDIAFNFCDDSKKQDYVKIYSPWDDEYGDY